MSVLKKARGAAAALLAAVCFFGLRRMAAREFGGMSGDLAGYDHGAVTLRIGEEEMRFEKDAVALVRLRCDF